MAATRRHIRHTGNYTGEGLAQSPYVAARGGVEPTTFDAEGTESTDNIHLTNHALTGPIKESIVLP